VKQQKSNVGYDPVITIDGDGKEQHAYTGYSFMSKERVAKRTEVMSIEEIAEKEAGFDAKERIRKTLADQYAQVAVELVKSDEPD